MDVFKDKMAMFWEQLCELFSQAKDAPRMIWEGSAEEPGTRIFLILAMIGVGSVILYSLVSFIKSSWKTRLWMLMILLIVLLVLAVIFYFALNQPEGTALCVAARL